MKINLTTTTITPPAESLLTFEQLKEADSGVYLCHTHQHENPSQRIIKDGEDLFLCDCRGFIVVPDDHQENAGCRFILAPEQVVNITFAKEERPECCGTVITLDEYIAKSVALSALATEEEYVAAQAAAGFKPGDKVRVARAADTRECGWDNTWTPGMDAYVDREVYTVRSIQEHGIDLEESATGKGLPDGSARFPFFVLEKVAAQFSAKFKVGDKVRVVREPQENENGWSDWVEQLAGAVGGVFKVEDVTSGSDGDIALLGADGYWFPFFVLEKVA